LDDKTKKKTLAEEMKKTYGTMRGSKGIVINRINEPMKRIEMKVMACNFLIKCRKEKVLEGVIAAIT
jgi:hypothetical protein